jgi:tRNA threonylcarbamoyladenosine biosynthesis protein TsaB
MLLLATDTSGKNGSVGLARVTPGHREVDVVEVVPLAGGTFSAQLVLQIAALLAKHGYTKSDLAAFAVVSGPGSFTGLRVGLAAIKALAEALRKPIAAVSLLEAVAWSSPAHGRILAALDAGRNEIYIGDYEQVDDKRADDKRSERDSEPVLLKHSERLLTREEFSAEAQGKRFVTPDAPLAESLRATGLECERINYPDSGVIARLGWQHLQRGQTIGPKELEANYIRRSDAEIFAQPGIRNDTHMPVRMTPAAIKIRAAVFDDVPAILALEQAAPVAAHWTAEQYKIRVQGPAQAACVLVAESQGNLCGFLCANIVAGEWEIENVVVAEEFRRHGIGAELMRFLIAQWEKFAGTALLLEVRESNAAARALYTKHGLREVGRRRGYYRDPFEEAVLYALLRPR